MIQLGFMTRIRDRFKEYQEQGKDLTEIKAFLKPIIEYGEAEEKRITEGLEAQAKRYAEGEW